MLMIWIDIVRTIATLISFLYASWSDYKTREVSNTLWIIFAPPIFTLTFLEIFLYNKQNLPFYGICFSLTAIFSIMLFYLGGFGGADAKALMCLALALPFYPDKILTPLLGCSPLSKVFFPLTIFGNAVLLAALTIVYTFLHNVFWHKKTNEKFFDSSLSEESLGKKILTLITGYKVTVEKLKEEKWRLYPLEDVEETEEGVKRKLKLIPKDEENEETIKRLEEAAKKGVIKNTVWVSPGLPMLIFITTGLITALLLGDLVWALISFLLS